MSEQEVAREQHYVNGLFSRLDDEVSKAQAKLAAVQRDVDPDNPDSDALVRRETEYHGLNAKLDALNLAEVGLVFGRIDVEDTAPENPVSDNADLDRRYIGRMGIDAPEDQYRTLLIDWRAPMARPFYLATTAHPSGVQTRRNIRMRGRTVESIDDEVLSGTITGDEASGVGSEAALRRAMNRPRTAHMQSIVETIQREQDAVIRDATRGVMVVEGGPGTGKTAVALHRVAYLLYTWRAQLAKTGVLILGPNSVFLDYISRVLPELGETGVVLSTVSDLVPGFTPAGSESIAAKEVKGSAEMVTILKRAVQAYETVPKQEILLSVENVPVAATPAMIKSARTKARRSRRPHNEAQAIFAERLCEQLARALAETIGADPLGGANLLSAADVDQLHDDLADDPQVHQLIDAYFPTLFPREVLRNLLEDRAAIEAVAYDYDEYTQDALYREPGTPESFSDAALLDELTVLIGGSPDSDYAEEDEKWQQQVAEAEDALDVLASSESTDNDDDQFEAEILSASDVIDAETLAQRQADTDIRSTAERARADRTWAYGHVIVDEAQELSPMEWRMVFRRCPSKWMTLVGDTAQTSAPAGSDDWSTTLEPFVGSRFRTHTLSVNYRTPSEVMDHAANVLHVIDPDALVPESIRSTGNPVKFFRSGTKPTSVATYEDGRTTMIIDNSNIGEMKGLEFDHVVLVEPKEIVGASPQGWQDLYVAMTRATQSLTIIGDLA